MSAVDEILEGIDLQDLASRLGVDTKTATSAATAAIPTLLSGLQANATQPDGQVGLLKALGDHTDAPTSLDAIDTEDGKKILGHMLADDPSRIHGLAGLDGGLLSKLLPILAPVVLAWLSGQVLGGQKSTPAKADSGILGDVLGGLVGGGGSTGGGLGDLLGQVLGGALAGQTTTKKTTKKPATQDAAGDLLGGLLNQILGR